MVDPLYLWVIIDQFTLLQKSYVRLEGLVIEHGRPLMTHKYRESIIVLSISKSVEPNEEQKEMTSGFQ